jgi:hypothetical protein
MLEIQVLGQHKHVVGLNRLMRLPPPPFENWISNDNTYTLYIHKQTIKKTEYNLDFESVRYFNNPRKERVCDVCK